MTQLEIAPVREGSASTDTNCDGSAPRKDSPVSAWPRARSVRGTLKWGWQDGIVSAPRSHPSTLTLHGVRLLGFADTHKIASRFGLDRGEVEETLLDFEAYGWVSWSEFAGSAGWSMTDRGRAENERRLAAELDASGARSTVVDVHSRFLPLNARFQETVTRWQVRPLPGDPMATNDHTDFRWDDRVIESLRSLGRRLIPLDTDLVDALARFGGYAERYNAAVARVLEGEYRWVDGLGVDSCHAVWMQLHEDLLASIGLDRGDERLTPWST